MIDYRILWKDGIHLTDDGTKILAAHVLNYLNINAENPVDTRRTLNVLCTFNLRSVFIGMLQILM